MRSWHMIQAGCKHVYPVMPLMLTFALSDSFLMIISGNEMPLMLIIMES